MRKLIAAAFLIIASCAFVHFAQATPLVDLAACARPSICPPISIGSLDPTVTHQGNLFNGPNELAQVDGTGFLPAGIIPAVSSTGTPNTVAYFNGSGNPTSSTALSFDGTTLGVGVLSSPGGNQTLTIKTPDTLGSNTGNILLKSGDTAQGGQSSNVTLAAGDTDPSNTHGGNGPAGTFTIKGGKNKGSDYARIELIGANTLPGPIRASVNIKAADQSAAASAGDINITAGANGGMVNITSPNNDINFTATNLYLNGSPVGSIPASVPMWHHYTLTYSSFSIAAMTNTITLFNLPAAGVIQGVKIKQSVMFDNSSAIASYTISVGYDVNNTKYASVFDVWQSPANDIFQMSNDFDSENHATTVPITVTAVTTGDNLNTDTQGVVDIWVLYSVAQ